MTRLTFARQEIQMNFLFLLGRLVYGGYFVYNGINHYISHQMLTGYAASKGVPQPHVAVGGSGVLALLGGLSLALGVQPKIGAGLIVTFLLGVSPNIHDFWNEEGSARMADMVNFTKNMALLGAAIEFMSRPEPWALSLATGNEEEKAAERVRSAAA